MTITQEQFEEVLRICGQVLHLDGPATPNTQILDAGVNSCDIVSLVATIEREFQVDFPLESLSLRTLATPASIRDALLDATPR